MSHILLHIHQADIEALIGVLLRLVTRDGRRLAARNVGIAALGADTVLYNDALIYDILTLAVRLSLITVNVLVLVTAYGSLRAALADLRRRLERNARVVRLVLILAVLTGLALAVILLRPHLIKAFLQIVDTVFELVYLIIEKLRLALLVFLLILVALLLETAYRVS